MNKGSIEFLLTPEEVAFRLGVNPRRVLHWVRIGRLGYVRLAGTVRIPPAEVARMIEQGRMPARPFRKNKAHPSSIETVPG
jgi:excisionase family DNA binding protein